MCSMLMTLERILNEVHLSFFFTMEAVVHMWAIFASTVHVMHLYGTTYATY